MCECKWMGIETAPKDGAAILVFAGGFCYSVEWCEEFDWWTVDDNKNGPYRLRGLAPTHWMSLPSSPSAAPQLAERVPLTEEQIYAALDADVDEIAAARADTESWGVIVTMVRAIEQAHGIRSAGVKEPGNAFDNRVAPAGD